MNIKLELIKGYIFDIINDKLEDFDIDPNEIANTTAIKALAEIQEILSGDDDDFTIVEKIVRVFERYNLDCGGQHDF